MRLSVLLVLALGACTTGELIGDLKPGMTTAEVSDLLGSPDGRQTSANLIAFQYGNRRVSGWSNDYADYVLVFENDQLKSWQQANVVTKNPDLTGLLLLNQQLQQQARPTVQAPVTCNTFGSENYATTTCR